MNGALQSFLLDDSLAAFLLLCVGVQITLNGIADYLRGLHLT